MSLHQRRRILKWVFLVLTAATTLVAVARAYEPAEHAAFVWDDHVLAERDAAFRHASIPALMTEPFWPDTPLADARAPYYRPVVLLSLRLDVARGATSAVLHGTNVQLHLLACLLLGIAAVRLGARPSAAILASLLWGLAPRLSESVVWIAGRTDLLAGMLGLAALATSPDVTEKPHSRGPRALVLSAMSGLLLFGALASKEVAIAFAVAIVIATLRARTEEAPSREWMVRLGTNVVAPVAAYLSLRYVALHEREVELRDLGAGRRLATALEAIGRYTEMLLDPLRPQTIIGMLGELDLVRAVIGGLLLVALVIAFVRLRPRAPLGVRVAAAVGGVALALVLHLVPFTLAGAVTADRLLYVPLAGLAIGLAVATERLQPRVRFAASILALTVACFFFGATKARAADYRDEVLFWVVAAERAYPHNIPLGALAGVVRDAGETELACRLYERANTILSRSERAGQAAHRRTRENLVGCWAKSGRYDDALRLAEELAREHPDSGRIQMELGFARLHVLDFDGAESALARANRIEPGLSRIVRPALEDVKKARKATPKAGDPSTRAADPSAHAWYLAAIGHLLEAEVAFSKIAEDTSASPDSRLSAARFLVSHGNVPLAERVLDTCAATVDVSELRPQLTARTRARADVMRLLPRIEALTRGS